MLRVEGDGGKRAYIGMGFQERGEAFDFQASLYLHTSSSSLSHLYSEGLLRKNHILM